MINASELILALDRKLTEFNYVNDPEIVIPNIQYISYVRDRAIFKVKNLCSVIDLPGNMSELGIAKNFMTFLKKSLLERYGDAFLWKELEMCFVVLSNDRLYKALKANDGKIMDETSFSLSSMLGTCFINKENIDYFSVSRWGVYFSGDHFKGINSVVEQWVEKEKARL